MLKTNIDNQFFNNFINRIDPEIQRQYPELNDIEIELIDDSDPDRIPYCIGKSSDSPFASICGKVYEGVEYNDILCFNDVATGLTEEEYLALIAHEIGHFVCHYKNIGISGQEEEIFADEVAMTLNFHNSLRGGLVFSKVCILKTIDEVMKFVPGLIERKQEQIQQLEERIDLVR